MENVLGATTTTTKPTADIARGADPRAIASCLKKFYGYLLASSPRDVKTNTSQNNNAPCPFLNEGHVVRVLDENNNVCLLPAPEYPGQD